MACSLFLMALLFLALTLPPGGHSIDATTDETTDPLDFNDIKCAGCETGGTRFCRVPELLFWQTCQEKQGCQIIVTKTNKIRRRCKRPNRWDCTNGTYEGEEAQFCDCYVEGCNLSLDTAKGNIRVWKLRSPIKRQTTETSSSRTTVTPSGIFFIVVATLLCFLS